MATPKIRGARPKDAQALSSYCLKFYAEGRWPVPADFDTILALMDHCIKEGAVLWAHVEGKPVGIIACIITPFVFNRHVLQGTELIFYVDEEYRRTGLGVDLLDAAETGLKLLGVELMAMATIENGTPDAAGKLYERHGFRKTETGYIKEL